jgi:hypothetical protein
MIAKRWKNGSKWTCYHAFYTTSSIYSLCNCGAHASAEEQSGRIEEVTCKTCLRALKRLNAKSQRG